MDKITKFLKKLSAKDRTAIQKLLRQLYLDDTKDLDIKKLKGTDTVFRIRKGNVRIIYTLEGSDIFILKIEFRNEGTYK